MKGSTIVPDGQNAPEIVKEENSMKNVMKGWQTPFTKTTDQAWSELEIRIAGVAPKKGIEITMVRNRWLAVAAAASVIAAVAWFAMNASSEIQVACLPAQHKQVQLPDGSMVELNASSSVTYSEKWDRIIELDGEAYFSVVPGKTFTVRTSSGDVRVLGTTFNVFDRKGDFRVVCTTGKVQVQSGPSVVILTPGESARLQESGLVESNTGNTITWKSGEFKYENEPLANVIAELERQFNISITTPELSAKMYTGSFYNTNLEEALALVSLPMGWTYEITSDVNVVMKEKQG